ncbi:MAG: hypothetical protein H0X64_08775 [Gemmatimonadaceae bacterium]|nr:hypothetical protein [Gemmatimonadaceae bacterium]
MAPRRVAGRRGLPGAMVLGLVAFVVVATGVIWRRSEGLERARTHQALEREREALIGQQRQLESDIRDASSRNRIAPVVEQRLGMRVPAAAQLIYLTRDSAQTAPDDSQ